MKIAIFVTVILVIILTCLLIKEIKKNIFMQKELKETDGKLTKYVADNLDMEKRLVTMEKDFKRAEEMSNEIRKIQEQSRLLKHDLKNHTMVIMSYLDEGRVEDARKYTSNLLDKLNKMYTYINVGNSLMNYILNSKLSAAKEKDIEIKAQIENLSFEYMESMDFSSVLNNILDNAIEGCINSDVKKIEVNISRKSGFDSIMIKNTIDKSVLENNPELITSKKESGHGLGILQIKKITEKYDGMVDIYEENQNDEMYFVINVVYPI